MPVTLNLALSGAAPGQLVVVYGVQTDAPDALPLVWKLNSALAPETSLVLPWAEGLQAYYCDATVGNGRSVGAVSGTACTLGQTFHLRADDSIAVEARGPLGQLSFLNDSASSWTFGCCLDNGDGVIPHFASALGAGNLIEAIPGPYVLLYFVGAKVNISAGQMIGASPFDLLTSMALPYTPILRIDLSQLAGLAPATLGYDAGKANGWQLPAPAPAWAGIFPPTSDIPSLAVRALPAT